MSAGKHRFGDRKNAHLVRTMDPFSKFYPYIMVKRNEANNLYDEAFRLNEVDAFLHDLRKQGYKGIGLMYFIITAYVRALAKYPALNRYVAGRRIYARDTIDAAMVVKRDMTLDGEETTIKVTFDPADTITDIYRKFGEAIVEIKKGPEDNNSEKIAKALTKLPRFLLRFVIGGLKVMDYYDLIPNVLLEASPFHATVMFTNLASLGIGPVFHHLYDFGALPVFVAFGTKRYAYELNAKGEVQKNTYVDIRFTMDERITDGFYFAAFLKEFKKPFKHPEILLDPPKEVVKDID